MAEADDALAPKVSTGRRLVPDTQYRVGHQPASMLEPGQQLCAYSGKQRSKKGIVSLTGTVSAVCLPVRQHASRLARIT
jgi:hypothetical protein